MPEPQKVFRFYTEIDLPNNLKNKLTETEEAIFCVKTFRDAAVFTNKRILVADRQGITGNKIEYYTIPYKSIVTYGIETAGTMDLDSEIKLTLTGGLNIEFKFFKSKEMNKLLRKALDAITKYVIG